MSNDELDDFGDDDIIERLDGMSEEDAAQRALVTANLASFLRRQPIWRLAPGDAPPQPLWTEVRPHWPDVAAALLPALALSACSRGKDDGAPVQAQRIEIRMVADMRQSRYDHAQAPSPASGRGLG